MRFLPSALNAAMTRARLVPLPELPILSDDARLVAALYRELQRNAGDHAFILQGDEGRVVFAIPFEREFTLVGTTDVDWSGDTSTPAITEGEIDYLLAIVGRIIASRASHGRYARSIAG